MLRPDGSTDEPKSRGICLCAHRKFLRVWNSRRQRRRSTAHTFSHLSMSSRCEDMKKQAAQAAISLRSNSDAEAYAAEHRLQEAIRAAVTQALRLPAMTSKRSAGQTFVIIPFSQKILEQGRNDSPALIPHPLVAPALAEALRSGESGARFGLNDGRLGRQ